MDTLRNAMPQWHSYSRLDTRSPDSDPESLKTPGSGSVPCWRPFAKRLLRLPLRTVTILIAAFLVLPGLLALTSVKVRTSTLLPYWKY